MRRHCSCDAAYSPRKNSAHRHSLQRGIQSSAQSIATISGSFDYIYQAPVLMSQALSGYETKELLAIVRSLSNESFNQGSVVMLPDLLSGKLTRVSITELVAEIIARRDQRPRNRNHYSHYSTLEEEFNSPSPPRRFTLFFFRHGMVNIYRQIHAKYGGITIAVFVLAILGCILLSIIVPILAIRSGSKVEPFATQSLHDNQTIRQIKVNLDCISASANFGQACDEPTVMIRYDRLEDKALLTLETRPINEQYCVKEQTSLTVHQLEMSKCTMSSAPVFLMNKNRCGQRMQHAWCQPHSLQGPIMYCYCTNSHSPDDSWTRAYMNDSSYEDIMQRRPCGMWTYNGKDKDGAKVPTVKYCTKERFEGGACYWLNTFGKNDSTEIVVREHHKVKLQKATIDEATKTWGGIYKTSTNDSFSLCEFELSSVNEHSCFDLQTFPSLPGANHSFHQLLSMWNNTWLVVRHGKYIVNGTTFRFVVAHNYDRKGHLLGQTPVTLYEQMLPADLADYEFVTNKATMINQDLHENRLLLVYQTGNNDQSLRTAINARVALLSFDFQ